MIGSERTRGANGGDGKVGRGTRGTGFPIVSLGEAVEIVKTAGRQRVDHTRHAFASYMGHSTINSGSFLRRLAALKDWGLITASGDRVVLTQLGRAIALPTSQEDEQLHIQAAFGHAETFSRMRELLPQGQPVQFHTIANSAVNNLGVAASSRHKFARSFAESAVFAGLAREVGPESLELIAVGAADVVTSGAEDQSEFVDPASRREGARGESRPVISPVWPIPGGEISFEVRLDRPMPARAWAQVGKITADIEDLVTLLGAEGQESDGVPRV